MITQSSAWPPARKLPYRPHTVPFHKIEDLLHDMATGDNHVVAVEVFDHPDSKHGSANPDNDHGVWLVGEATDVYDQLAEDGYVEYEEQSSIDHTEAGY